MADSDDLSTTRRNTDETARITVDEAINKYIRFYFYPAIYGRGFLKAILFLVVLLGFLLPMFLLIPAVQSKLSCEWLHINKDSDLSRSKYVLDLVSANVKIFILLALGGAIFKAVFIKEPSERVKNLMKKFQKKADKYMKKRPSQIRREMSRNVSELLKVREEVTRDNLFDSVVRAKKAMSKLYESAQDIPKYYLYFMFVGPFVYFPGGFYGFLAFILFLVDNFTSVGKIYVNYPPEIAAC